MEMIRKFLCWVGLHARELLLIDVQEGYEDPSPITLRYQACARCGDGDPRVTGEW